jgi:hypothetical protein
VRQIPVPARQIITGGSPNISTMTYPLAGTTASSMASSSPSTAAGTAQRIFLDPLKEFIYDCSQFELNAGAEDSGDEDELLIDQEVEEEAILPSIPIRNQRQPRENLCSHRWTTQATGTSTPSSHSLKRRLASTREAFQD